MNRDKFIKIRVSADELAEIKYKAEIAGMNIRNFIRTSALKGKIIRYDTENIYRFNQLLRSIGVNINQIATVANSEKSVFSADIISLRDEVNKIPDEFHKLISTMEGVKNGNN